MGRIIIVSNRVSIPRKGSKSAGGLEVVIRATLKRHGGIWFGWSGSVSASDRLQIKTVEVNGVTHTLTDLSKEDYEEYYSGFANRVLWPILHYRIDLAEFSRRDLSGYMRVNQRLANEVHSLIQPGDTIWVHDYHLIPFAKILRDLGHKNRIGFFLHIPFPPPEVITALPNYRQLLSTMLDYDLVGLQTDLDASNFARFMAQENLLPNHISRGTGMRIGTFPVGIEVAEFQRLAAEQMQSSFIRNVQQSARAAMIIGVDRLDYSKGLDLRLQAYEKFLSTYPEWRGKATYLQITPHSRSQIAEYRSMEDAVRNLVGRINGKFGEADWTPLRYVNRMHTREELAGLYRAASIGLVTPLRDGMNLVAKEYVAAQDPENPGVLVLSKFAGAAAEMRDALLVNPHDRESVAAAIAQGLSMSLDERRLRHRKLMDVIEATDVTEWGEKFLAKLNHPPTRIPHKKSSTVLADVLRERFSSPFDERQRASV